MHDLYALLQSAAHSGAHGINNHAAPTHAQHKAGNYRVGKLVLHGLPISIEQPRNSFREGVDPSGTAWRCRMAADYGYIRGVVGADGDNLDVFIGVAPENTRAFVINQCTPDTGEFDEHKVMLGFMDEADARRGYLESYSRGWKGLGSIVPCTLEQLKWWFKHGDLTRPLTASALPYDGNSQQMSKWDSDANPVGNDIAGLIYNMRRDDTDGLLLDAVTVTDIVEDADAVLALDALVTPYNQVQRKMTVLQTVMEGAGGEVKPVAMQVTEPFKQRGTTNVAAVYELSDGQTVSIFFHNPDTTPAKIQASDDLISWKWMLNKKDITLLVAPENGKDLNVREVARRIMKLAEKNSQKFQQANKNRAERMQQIEGLKASVQERETTLEQLTQREAELQAQLDAKQAASPLNNLSSFEQWRGDTFYQIEVQGDMTSSDAEAVAAAQGSMMEDLFAAGETPEAAAAKILAKSRGEESQPADTGLSGNVRDVDHIPAVMTDTNPMPDVPGDWIIMNAPRPLVGDKTVEGGEFLDGRFYAAINPNDSTAALYIESNRKNAASIVMVVPAEKQAAMAITGSKYEDKYLAMPVGERLRAAKALVNKLNGKPYGELKALLAAAKDFPVGKAVSEDDRRFVSDAADGKVDFMDAANIDRLEAIDNAYPAGELSDLLEYAKTAAKDQLVDAINEVAA